MLIDRIQLTFIKVHIRKVAIVANTMRYHKTAKVQSNNAMNQGLVVRKTG